MLKEILVRFVVGGLVVSMFSMLSDILKPKSFAGLFGAAPSVALATVGLAIATEGTAYAALEARSMVGGAIAMFVYACLVMLIMLKLRPPAILASTTLLAAWLATSISFWFFVLRQMVVKFELSTLRRTKWYELVLRFAFGGLATVATGMIGKSYGPIVGGLFLAFPAIFPASATLVEKHEKEKKRRAHMDGVNRARHAVAVEARGTALGSIGLAAFAIVVWQSLVGSHAWLVLASAALIWFVISLLVWQLRRLKILREALGLHAALRKFLKRRG